MPPLKAQPAPDFIPAGGEWVHTGTTADHRAMLIGDQGVSAPSNGGQVTGTDADFIPADPNYSTSTAQPHENPTLMQAISNTATKAQNDFDTALGPKPHSLDQGILGNLETGAGNVLKSIPHALGSIVMHPEDTGEAILRGSPLGVLMDSYGYDPNNPGKSTFDLSKSIYGDMAHQIATNPAESAETLIPQLAAGTLLGHPYANPALRAGGAAMEGAGKAGRFLSATPEAQRLAFTRELKPGTPMQALGDALKPTQSERPDFMGNFNETFPPIAATNPSGVAEVASQAGRLGRGQLKDFARLRAPFRDAPVDMTPVAKAQIGSTNRLDLLEHPGIESRTAGTASRYVPDTEPTTVTQTSPILDQRGDPITTEKLIPGEEPTTMRDVDALRRETNQKLQPFYQKAEGNKYTARANPEVRRLEASGNALRGVEYGNLSDLSGVPEEDIRAGQNRYGAFHDLGDIATRQANRMATTTDPTNIAGVDVFRPKSTVMRYVGNRLLGDVDSPNALVRSAVDRFQNPEETPMPMGGGAVKPLLRGVSAFPSALGSLLNNGTARNLMTAPIYPLTTTQTLLPRKDNQ